MKNIIYNFLNNTLSIISNTLFPVHCIVCKKESEYLCGVCENKLELSSENNFGKINNFVYAKYKYKNQYLKKIEYAIKYNHHPKLAETMGEYSYKFIYENIIAASFARSKKDIKCNLENKNSLNSKNIYLVPIPISKNRLKERGYNQTEYIAKGIQNKFTEEKVKNKTKTNLEMLDILNRENTKKLKDVYGIDNRANEIRNSMRIDNSKLEDFLLKNKIDISNLKSKENMFILIDDITTTGSTFYEARKALTDYGIIGKNIYGYALAH